MSAIYPIAMPAGVSSGIDGAQFIAVMPVESQVLLLICPSTLFSKAMFSHSFQFSLVSQLSSERKQEFSISFHLVSLEDKRNPYLTLVATQGDVLNTCCQERESSLCMPIGLVFREGLEHYHDGCDASFM
jgi:hypothetical protein